MPDDRADLPRQPLSADRIATEALRLIDEKGLDGFSFRILAKQLGCQAMSIYHYYPSKAHLYEALVDILIAETPVPPPGPPWRDRIVEFCQIYRQTALRHPGFFLYFITFRLNNRSGMAFLNSILELFGDSGLPVERQAVWFRTMGYYVSGAGLDEAMGYAHGPSAVEPVPWDVARRDYPAIAAVGAYFGKEWHRTFFDTGVDLFVTAMEREAAEASTKH